MGVAVVEVYIVGVVRVVHCTTPIAAQVAGIVELAVVAAARTGGRQKYRVSGSFICKFPTSYSANVNPFVVSCQL